MKSKIKKLEILSDQKSAIKIFDEVWSIGNGTEITPNLLQAMVHGGAYLSGAFMDGKCVGAAFAFPATTGGLHLHSHMTSGIGQKRIITQKYHGPLTH
jgi:predicted GNAT superfamily acetyltransferase